MSIQLRNRTREALTVELTSLGQKLQTDVHVLRDPGTGASGKAEVVRSFPAVAVFLPGRGVSQDLPDEVATDPAVLALSGVIEVVKAKAAPNPGALAPKEQ